MCKGSYSFFIFFFKQKTAYEMRISDWSSDVCSSDLPLNVAFLAVSGSEANEAAMKLCERIQLPKRKTKFMCMQGGFHGKTHGALSLTTAADFQRGFLLGVPKENVIYVPYGDIAAVKAAIEAESPGNGTNGIIAALVEPIRGTAS